MNSRRKRREKISAEKSGIDGKKERLIFSLDISSHTFYAVFDFPPPASTNFSWVSEDCDSLDQLSLSIGVRAILSWICKDSAQFQKETWKIKRSLVVNVLQATPIWSFHDGLEKYSDLLQLSSLVPGRIELRFF